MYLMYVDESGDPGRNSPARHFILSALIIPAVDWQASFDRHHQMRRYLKATYGYPVRAELHAASLVDTRYGGKEVRGSVEYEDCENSMKNARFTAGTGRGRQQFVLARTGQTLDDLRKQLRRGLAHR